MTAVSDLLIAAGFAAAWWAMHWPRIEATIERWTP